MGKSSEEAQLYAQAQANATRNYNLRKIKEPDELVRLFDEYLDTCVSTIVKAGNELEVNAFATKAGFYRYLVKTKGFKPQSVKRWFRELPRDFDDAKEYIQETLEDHNTLSAGKGDIVAQVFNSFAKAKYEDYKDVRYHEHHSSTEMLLKDMSNKELLDKFNAIALLESDSEDEE